MLSCSRSCLHHEAIPFISKPNSPVREPLLFLYPPWYRKHHRKLHQAAKAVGEDGSASRGQETRITPTRQRSQSSPQKTGVTRDHQRHPLSHHPKRSYPTIRPIHHEIARIRRVATSDTVPDIINEYECRRATQPSCVDLSITLPNHLHANDERKKAGNLEQEAGRLLRIAAKARFRSGATNWRAPLKALVSEMREPRPPDGEVMKLARYAVFELSGSYEENVWMHLVRSGCEIHVLPNKSVGPRDQHVVLLRGEKRARELTKEYLVGFERKCMQSARIMKTGTGYSQDIRYWQAQPTHLVRHCSYGRAEDLPRPETWTVRSFADYVEDLVMMRIPRAFRQELCTPGSTHNQQVVSILESLFRDEELAPYFSTRAFNYALSFACRHSELWSSLTTFYDVAKSSELSLPATTFNIVIESTLKLKQKVHFNSVLRDMRTRHVAPNSGTLAKLLAIVPDQDAGRRIITYMHAGGLLESGDTAEDVAVELVKTDFLDFARREDGLEEFLEAMDDLLGKQWVSARVFNNILRLSALSGRMKIASQVTKMGVQRGVRFKSSTMTFLFKLTQKRGYLRAALDLLQSKFAFNIGWDESFVIPSIFMTAWKHGFYNVGRVLWQYAATRGIISPVMQKVVMASLTHNIGLENSVRQRSAYSLAGKLTIIDDTTTLEFIESCPLLTSKFQGTTPLRWLILYTPNDSTRQEQLSVAFVMMHRNLTAWKKYHPMGLEELFRLLETAYDKDYSWRIRNFLNTASSLELLENTIKIQLFPAVAQRRGPSFNPGHLPLLRAPAGVPVVEQKSSNPNTQKEKRLAKLIAASRSSGSLTHFRTISRESTALRLTSTSLKRMFSIALSRTKFPSPFTQRRYISERRRQVFQRLPTDQQPKIGLIMVEGKIPIVKYISPHPRLEDFPSKPEVQTVMTEIEKLRVRSAFITWNTSVTHIKTLKHLDYLKLRHAITLPNEVSRKWLIPAHISQLLHHIKQSYTSYEEFLHPPAGPLACRPKYYIFRRDLENFEDLAVLQFVCAKLLVRGRAIWRYLLDNPNSEVAHWHAPWLKRRIAAQAASTRALEALVRPFFEQWQSAKKAERRRSLSMFVLERPKVRGPKWDRDFQEYLAREVDWRSLAAKGKVVDLSCPIEELENLATVRWVDGGSDDHDRGHVATAG